MPNEVVGFKINGSTYEYDHEHLANLPTIDATPTANSTNAVQSGGVKSALDGLQAEIPTVDSVPTQGSTNAVSSGGVWSALQNIDVTTDTTLSVSGKPADAKVVGDKIEKLKTDLNAVIADTMDVSESHDSITPTFTTESGYMGTNGAVTASTSYVHTSEIDVQKGDVITPTSSRHYFRFVTAFSGETAVTASGASSASSYTVPDGITSVVLSYSSSYTMIVTITRTEYSYAVTGLDDAIADIEALESKVENIASDLTTERNSYSVRFIEPTYEAYEMNTSGVVGSSASYKHTEKIAVSAGDVITIYKDNMTRSAFDNHSYRMRFITAFNGNSAVSAKGGDYVGIYTVPEGVDSIVVSVYVSQSSQDHEQQIRIETAITEAFSDSFNILNGKKWCACGDSFTAAGYDHNDGVPFNEYTFASGRFAGKNRTYPWIIGLRNNMDIVNMAVSGMSMANSTGSNAFVLDDYYKGIPSDADYITFKFGINDLNHDTTIGTIDSTDPTTFYGAWNVVMDYITENYPLAKIGIIVTNGLGSANTYADAIIAIAKKWGIPYLDEVYDYKVPLLHRVSRPDVSSAVAQKKLETFRVSETNTHPNINAQYYEASFVEEWLRTL